MVFVKFICMLNSYVEVVDSWDGWLQLEPYWNTLVESSQYPSIYSSFEFLTIAWKHYHSKKSRPLILLIKDSNSHALIGIAPFRIETFRWFNMSLQACEYLVTNDVDKPYIIPLKGEDERCWLAVGKYMVNNASSWDLVELMEIRDGLAYKSFQSCFNLPRFHSKVAEDSSGLLIDLTESWDVFYRGHKKFRKKLRVLEGKLNDGFTFEYTKDEAEAQQALERYIELEANSWKHGKIGVSRDEKHLGFYRELIPLLAAKGQVHFGFLASGNNTLSGEIAYSFADQVYFCHGTFDQKYAEFSPGKVSTGLFIGELTGKEFTQGDFLCGFANYMNPWSTGLVKTSSLFIYKISPKILYVFSILALFKILRPIKNSLLRMKKWLVERKGTLREG